MFKENAHLLFFFILIGIIFLEFKEKRNIMLSINETLIKEFSLKPFQVENTLKLIDEGNKIPFIARYRKEATGEM